MLWTIGRMIKADLKVMSRRYIFTEAILYIVAIIFTACLFAWWLSTTWIFHGVGRFMTFIMDCCVIYLGYQFTRVVILGRPANPPQKPKKEPIASRVRFRVGQWVRGEATRLMDHIWVR